MKVFISWSGPLSCKLAGIISQWLRGVLQAVQPFYSPDMDRGIRWSSELAKELEGTNVGLLCLTRDNLESRWIMFEAGALSKMMDKARLCPILFNLQPSDIERPLSDFNMTTFDKPGMKKIVETINRVMVDTGADAALDDKTLDLVFDKWWPDLERDINHALESEPQAETQELRNPEDLLVEILGLTRVIESRIQEERYFSQELQSRLAAAIENAKVLTKERDLRSERNVYQEGGKGWTYKLLLKGEKESIEAFVGKAATLSTFHHSELTGGNLEEGTLGIELVYIYAHPSVVIRGLAKQMGLEILEFRTARLSWPTSYYS